MSFTGARYAIRHKPSGYYVSKSTKDDGDVRLTPLKSAAWSRAVVEPVTDRAYRIGYYETENLRRNCINDYEVVEL